MVAIVVLDFEGTSRLASARATEIGLVTLTNTLAIKYEFESLVNSPVTPDQSALAVSRLSKSEISSAPSFKELWPLLRNYFSGNLLIAHNKIYEINVLENEFRGMSISGMPPFFCTLEWSRKILGTKVRNHTLPTLCDYFDIELDHAHEAIADARATALLLGKLAAISPELNKELTRLQSETVQFADSAKSAIQPRPRERFQTESGNAKLVGEAILRITQLNKRLVVVTGTPDDGKEEFGMHISSVGLEYRETPPTMGTAFVVQSNNSPGMSKIRRALELGVPVLSESDALLLMKTLRGKK